MAYNRVYDCHPVITYSSLIDWMSELSMRSAMPQQWLATILSAKGLRKEEVEQSGLIYFLLELDEAYKVAKEQLLDIARHGLLDCQLTLRVEQSTTYRPSLQSAAFSAEAIPKKVLDTFSDGEVVSCHKLVSFNYKLIRLKFTGMFGSGESWFVFDEHWCQFKPSKSYSSAVDAVDFLYTVAANRFSKYTSKAPRNFYERYSLLGKNNSYKEWIICLPNWPEAFEQSHFDLVNVILHIRTSEWKDTNDQPLLLIDEIQSDWHACGRENGYYEIGADVDEGSGAVPKAPFQKEWHELGIKLAIRIALQSGHRRVAFTTASIHKARYGRDLDGFSLLYDQLIPKALVKLAAKFKCAVVPAIIAISKPNDTINYKNGSGWELRNNGKDEKVKIIKNEVVAMRYLVSRGQKKLEEVRVLEISPYLADIFNNKGLPLFGW